MSVLALLIGLLKIIGIILALLLLIVCIIIFSNINLKLIFNNNSEIYYSVKVSYILGLFIYILDSEKNINCFKIFGINIEKLKKLKVKRKNSKKLDKNINDNETNNKEDIEKNDDTAKIEKKDSKEAKIEVETENINKDNVNEQSENDLNKGKFKQILSKFKLILNYPDKKEIVEASFLLVKKLIKSIKFKKIKLNIDYGLDEPFKTGNICGIISTIIPFLPKKYIKNINIIPDFEKEVFLADIQIKCKTSLFKILLPIIIFITKKPIRKIIFRKGE